LRRGRAIHAAAFGSPVEADLTEALLADPGAQPCLSLLALGEQGQPLGHILFSRATLAGQEAALLAPLAVYPDHQRQGVGLTLINAGLDRLRDRGVALLCTFGDPAYYSRAGFGPATALGIAPPQPIAEADLEAWQAQALGDVPVTGGKLVCAPSLDDPALWTAD